MGATILQVFSLALGVSAAALLIISNLTDCWRSDAKDPHSSIGLSYRCRGLWGECIYDITAGYWTCDVPTSFLGNLPNWLIVFCLLVLADLVITRALAIVACIACVVATLVLISGMKCTKFVSDGGTEKDKLIICAGTIFFLGGIAGGIGMTWYAAETVIKYKFEVSFEVPGITYELAYSYWLASTGVLCTCLAGVLLVSTHCAKISRSSQRKKRKPAFLFLTDQYRHTLPAPCPTIGKTYV
ncbi:claudin-16-like [Heptranchias perlo]|uniref:claudin-16-like n=1 Tax=Heptranchias perlo TaxID=212740 RepID=UPI00355962CC